MAPMQKKIVIVGASLAGLRAAEAARQLGFEGSLTLLGAEEHMPYDRPPLSKDVLKGDWEPERTALIRDQEGFDALNLDLRLGVRATALDAKKRQVELAGGERIDYDGLVIATGASPRNLPGANALEGVFVLRTLDDCMALRRALEARPRVAVVGAGFIGAEVAATCRARGLDVTMIEALPVPLEAALGRDVGEALAEVHREHGVDVRLGVGVDALEGEGRVTGVRLSDGSRVEASVVVVGIGVTPNVAWLDGSGIGLDNGIVCNERCGTSLPGVVACGDVAQWENPLFGEAMRVEHWSNAAEQARAAVEHLLKGDDSEPFASVPFFWSDQYDLKIQSAGRCGGADQSEVVSGSIADRKFVKLYGKNGKLMGALAFNEPRKLIKYRRTLREPTPFDQAVKEARA